MWFLVGRVDTRPFFCVILKRTGAAACVAIVRAGEKKKIFEYFLEKKDTEYFVN